jgi:hypothetical protein
VVVKRGVGGDSVLYGGFEMSLWVVDALKLISESREREGEG